MEIIQKTQNVHLLKHSEKRLELFLASDIHFDSQDCHRELFKKHLKQIQEKEGYALFFGDLFDVMGAYKDPRSKNADVRSEYVSHERSYLDLVVEDCYEFLKPFKDNILFMGYGNHETAIQKHRDTDILDRLVFMMNQNGSSVMKGGYEGYLVFAYKSGTHNGRKVLAYHHGHGGAKRSKGVLNSQLDFMKYRDADIIVSGHCHNKIHDPSNVGYYLDQTYNIRHRDIDWLKLGSYKRNDKNPGIGGWTVEKGFLPTKMGGWFCTLNTVNNSGNIIINTEIREAK